MNWLESRNSNDRVFDQIPYEERIRIMIHNPEIDIAKWYGWINKLSTHFLKFKAPFKKIEDNLKFQFIDWHLSSKSPRNKSSSILWISGQTDDLEISSRWIRRNETTSRIRNLNMFCVRFEPDGTEKIMKYNIICLFSYASYSHIFELYIRSRRRQYLDVFQFFVFFRYCKKKTQLLIEPPHERYRRPEHVV